MPYPLIVKCLIKGSLPGRAASSALRVHEYMQKKPLAAIGALADALKLPIATVTVA
jgi:hypothetical protein